MTNVSSENYWYELETVGDENGKPIRKYVVTCRDCGRRDAIGANTMGLEQMRKNFMAKGWNIAKHRQDHLCGECIERRTEAKREKREEKRERREIKKLEQKERRQGINRLETHWINAPEDEKREFYNKVFAPDIQAAVHSQIDALARENEDLRARLKIANELFKDIEDKGVETLRRIAILEDENSILKIKIASIQEQDEESPPAPPPPPPPKFFIVLEPGLTPFDWGELLTESECNAARKKYGDGFSVRLAGPGDRATRTTPLPEPSPVVSKLKAVGAEIVAAPEPEQPPPEPVDDDPAAYWRELKAKRKAKKR